MINLYFDDCKVYVFDVKDWEKIRTEYRIIGKISGLSQTSCALPVILLPEEVYVLVTKGLARIIALPDLKQKPNNASEDKFKNITNELLQAEKNMYKCIRKKELEGMIDTIVEGKRRKNSCSNYSKEDILKEELEKSVSISEKNMLWPLVSSHYTGLTGLYEEVPLSEVLKETSLIKCKIFMDLWEKGYYITAGNKFGGDFLAYLGDPVAFHAVFIIHCLTPERDELFPCEIVALGRLSTSVRKKTVFAFVKSDNSVSYYTLNWFDSE